MGESDPRSNRAIKGDEHFVLRIRTKLRGAGACAWCENPAEKLFVRPPGTTQGMQDGDQPFDARHPRPSTISLTRLKDGLAVRTTRQYAGPARMSGRTVPGSGPTPRGRKTTSCEGPE